MNDEMPYSDPIADAAVAAAEQVTKDYIDRRSDAPPNEENIAMAVVAAVAPMIEAHVHGHYRARVLAELQHLADEAAAERQNGASYPDGHVAGYLNAMRTAIAIAQSTGDTPAETPTERVRAGREAADVGADLRDDHGIWDAAIARTDREEEA